MTSRPPGHRGPAGVGRRGRAFGAAVSDRRTRLLGSPKRELRESALLYRKPNRIPSARASGFPGSGSRRDRRLARVVGRGRAIGAAVFDRRARLLGSPKRELRESALLYRKPNRIPSARASGFPAAGSRRLPAKQSSAGCRTPPMDCPPGRRAISSRRLPAKQSSAGCRTPPMDCPPGRRAISSRRLPAKQSSAGCRTPPMDCPPGRRAISSRRLPAKQSSAGCRGFACTQNPAPSIGMPQWWQRGRASGRGVGM
jgi:hypothetical protein